MLQIATGKLFTRPAFRNNQLTGTLFSNAARMFEPLVTKAGTVQWTNALGVRTPSMTYHVNEAIEADKSGRSVIISFGVDSYLQDFSSLMTFYFGIICSPDADLVARLTRGKAGIATKAAPNQLVRAVFDPVVDLTDAQGFSTFVTELLGLKRDRFREVMQAIRTLVTGLHRMGDDLEVAYALMVAALESLASGAGSTNTTWEDLPSSKRDHIDNALDNCGASDEICKAVRSAVARTEHGAKLLKFKAFIQDTVPSSFFREDGLGQTRPVGKLDFKDALDTAYDLRSKYVHALTRLPDEVTFSHSFADVVVLHDRRPCMTFQGLVRVSRAVILAYVKGLPSVETEPCHYMYDIPNISQVRFAPSGFMHPDRVMTDNGKQWLQDFLEVWDQDVLGSASPSMADLKPCLDRAVGLLPQMKQASRRAYLALIFAVRMTMPKTFWATKIERLIKDHEQLFEQPSAESLMLYALSPTPPAWKLEDHERAIAEHFQTRRRHSGLVLPERIEAAIMLDLVERYRLEGQWNHALRYLDLACQYFPSFNQLRELHATATPTTPIQWIKVLVGDQFDGETDDGSNATKLPG